MPYDHALSEILAEAGGPTKLAAHLGITTSAVTNWSSLPTKHLAAVSKLTGWPVSRLRPDLFEQAAA